MTLFLRFEHRSGIVLPATILVICQISMPSLPHRFENKHRSTNNIVLQKHRATEEYRFAEKHAFAEKHRFTKEHRFLEASCYKEHRFAKSIVL